MTNAARKNKFRNVPTVVHGIRFDSKREAKYWVDLTLREMGRDIRDLQRQVRFPLVVAGIKIGTYVADFVYHDNSGRHVVDVKSPATAKLPVYRIKKKLMAALHGIHVEEWL